MNSFDHRPQLQIANGARAARQSSILLSLCVLCVFAVRPANAQSAHKLNTLAKVNEARRANGAPPLAWNAQLDKAAQRHSDDMASKGFVDEIGSAPHPAQPQIPRDRRRRCQRQFAHVLDLDLRITAKLAAHFYQ
jgi:uncharacterized protein YkwD